jgi:hypothetical protein
VIRVYYINILTKEAFLALFGSLGPLGSPSSTLGS